MPTPAQVSCIAPELSLRLDEALALPKAFVVGCQKSGTTWVQRILGAHPEVCSHGEARIGTLLLPLLAHMARTYNQQQRAGEINRFENDQLHTVANVTACVLFARWLEAEPDPSGIRLIAEKTPEHAVALELLDSVFEGCRVVHIIRDGRDCAVSGWFHQLRKNADSFKARFPTMAAYADYFAREHWAPYIRAAQAWGATNPDRYHELRYETLVEDPHDTYAAIFRFLDVRADDETVQACVERTTFRAMTGREAGEQDESSHFRKGVVGDWREHLDAEAQAAFERPVRELMCELAYAA